jgi:secreted PhoX family phosphatase
MYGQINKADGTMMNVCNNPDGNMFLPTATDGSEGYLYTNWECSPGGVSKVYIKRTEGKWSSLEGESVDLLAAGGTQNNCNASVTPWGSALTSEEYPPDVEGEWGSWQDTLKATETYLGAKPNPYAVGYPIEMIPGGGEDNGLNTVATKHYAMGRQSWEMALVMPDHKTVYSGNDGSDRVMLKFVADKAGDLSAGTVYAAKVKQDGEKLNLSWIELGKGNDADVAKAIEALGATIK